MSRKSLIIISLLLLALVCGDVFACRIVPTPPANLVILPPPHRPSLLPIQVKAHNVEVTIKDGVTTTVLESVFFNPNHQILEGTYIFPLPKGASISQFSMWIDGKEMQGELLDSQKARDLYISIVRRMIDPGLLEFVGRETFKMSIFPIPANGDKKVKLSYQQILPLDANLMRYVYPLTTVGNGREDILGQLNFKIDISSKIPLKSIFSPSHKVEIKKEENQATVTYSASNVNPDKDFTLYISCSDRKVDLSFIPFRKGEEQGYFLLMLSPKVKLDPKEQNPKDVVFAFDTSGSMVGDKIQQAQEALKYCLNSLKEGDRFNIIPFSTEARPYKTSMIPVTKENIKLAFEFIAEEIYARGGTNFEEALGYSIEMAPKEGNRPYMVIFLTDGKPTMGVREPDEIVAKVKKANCANLRLFTFGVGEDLNAKLLDQLAEENKGAREYVGSKEDIEIKVSAFFDKVSSPVLSDIKIQFPSTDGLRVSEVYPRNFPDLFKGSQITMLGRYSGNGDQVIKLNGVLASKPQEFVFEVSFPKESTENSQIPRLWAVRKIGYLLDSIRLSGEDPELKKEVVMLAKKFGIVTPYTSYLVLEDDPRIGDINRPSVIRPMRQEIERRMSADNESKRSFEKAGSAMKKEDGEDAVKTSQKFKAMKEAEHADEGTESPKPAAPAKDQAGFDKPREQKFLKQIDEKTFYLQDNVWYDSEYNEKAAKIKIKYLSDEYFKLIQDKPGIGKFLAIGSKVVIVFENQTYEIHE